MCAWGGICVICLESPIQAPRNTCPFSLRNDVWLIHSSIFGHFVGSPQWLCVALPGWWAVYAAVCCLYKYMVQGLDLLMSPREKTTKAGVFVRKLKQLTPAQLC